jgi:predicted CoA-binding protein
MNHDSYPDAYIADILRSMKTIAVVGASPNEMRPSFGVTRFLAGKGYDVVAINPGHAGGEIAGCPVFASLADVPHSIDMVDVFRNSDDAG